MPYRKLPDRDAVLEWLSRDERDCSGQIRIPLEHFNAFMGLARSPHPAPLLDEAVIKTNLARKGLGPEEIEFFLSERSSLREDGWPLIARRYEFL